MKENSGFFQSRDGTYSSSRLIGVVIITAALIFIQEIILIGHESIVESALAAGILFTTIATPALVFLFGQKKTEVNQEVKEKEIATKYNTIEPKVNG